MDPRILESYDRVRTIADKPFRALCYAPFTSMFFDTVGLVRACCVNRRYILGDIRKERLDEIWFGEKTQKLRDAMRRDDLKLGCEFCAWQLKDGNFSEDLATYHSLHALKYDAFSVADDDNYWPSNLEFNLSNTCNLECVTCSGEFSSAIRSHRENLPAMPRVYQEEFFEDIRKYIPHVRSAQFLGGEPFLINEHFRIWEMMVEAQVLQQCEITTNGTIYNRRVQWVLDNLPVSLTMSMDGVTKETFEKIRLNAKYEVFMENFHRFHEYAKSNNRWINFNFTLSRLNWHELADMLLFAEKYGCSVSICTLVAPETFSMYTMHATELEKVIRSLESRNAEMMENLTLNLPTWIATVNNLRHRLEHAHEKLDVLKPQVADRQVDAFRHAVLMSATEHAAHVDTLRRRLREWSGAPIDMILGDLEDAIIDIQASGPGGFLGLNEDFEGKSITDAYGILIGHFGPMVAAEDVEVTNEFADRIVHFQREGAPPIILRVVTLPRFDDARRVVGVQILATRQSSAVTAVAN